MTTQRRTHLLLTVALCATGCFAPPDGDGDQGSSTGEVTASTSSTGIPATTATTSSEASTGDPSASTSTSGPGDSSTSSSEAGDSSSSDADSSSSDETGPSAVCGNGVTEAENDESCDDGNDDDLDGCLSDCRFGPTGISFGDLEQLEQYGNVSGGAAVDDACPMGEVIIGLRGHAGGSVGRIQVVCGTLTLVDPDALALSLVENTVFPMHGEGGGEEFDRTCPENHAVVGFSGREGLLVDRITLRCAPLSLADDGSTITLEVGDPVELAPVGGDGGAPFPVTDCAEGSVATIGHIRFGDAIDAFGVSCQPVSASYE